MRVVIGLIIAIAGAVFQSPPAGEADAILSQLSKIRIDKKQIYKVRDTTIRRDVLTITLSRGVIAFLEPVNGKVTGSIFIGSGEIVAIPPNPIEKQQIYRFTGTPILNESFQTALFRFTDNTYEEIRKEISQHAEEELSSDEVAQFDPLETLLTGRATVVDTRLLADLLEPTPKPFFLGELKGDKTGWFDVAFDMRAAEEVSIFQVQETSGRVVADIWASFNQRSEARDPEAVAHENRSPVDILSQEIDGTARPDNNIDAKLTMRIKARTEGARVLNFELAPALRVTSVLMDRDAVPYYQYPNARSFIVVLPRPLNSGQELMLVFTYGGQMTGQGPWYPSQRQQNLPSFKSSIPLPDDGNELVMEYSSRKVAPASYHDEWLIQGLTGYLAVLSKAGNDSTNTQLRKVLNDAREVIKPIESAGPISLGHRLVSTRTPDADRALYGKGIWIIHMLRMMLQQDGPAPDAKFLAMLQEFAETYGGKTASSWDFQHLAEKYAGKKLDWFFEQWVFATGLPSYSAEYKIEASGSEFTIDGTITQAGVPDGFTMPVPVYGDGVYLGTVQVGDSDGRFKFSVSKRPERLVIDPEMTILTAASQ